MNYCYKCHHEVELTVKATRSDQCEFCRAFLRCCYNCKYHDESYPNECMEPTSAYVANRESGNFCGFFQFAEGKDRLGDKVSKDDVKNQLDSLFKK